VSERGQERERMAATVTDRKFRDQWLDSACQWRELAELARRTTARSEAPASDPSSVG
jgi:hypothetical protein